MIKEVLIITGLVIGIVCAEGTETPPQKNSLNVGKAWGLDLGSLSLDPNSWNDVFKDRVFKVLVSVGYAASVGFGVAGCMAYGVFVLGLKRLSWALVAAASAVVFGIKKKNWVFLYLGAVLSYALAFGMELMG